MNPAQKLVEAGLMKELKIRLMERMLGAELTARLGYEEAITDAFSEWITARNQFAIMFAERFDV